MRRLAALLVMVVVIVGLDLWASCVGRLLLLAKHPHLADDPLWRAVVGASFVGGTFVVMLLSVAFVGRALEEWRQ